VAEEAGAPLPLAVVGVVVFLVTADARVVTPLLPLIARDFHVDVGAAGWLVTAYAIPYGVCQIAYGPLGDRLGKLRVMNAAVAVFAVGTMACAFAPTLLMLDAMRLITGAAAAAVIPMAFAYIGDTLPYRQRQAAIGQVLTAVTLGIVLSASLGGIFADFLSWRAIFVLFGTASVVAGVALWRAVGGLPATPAASSTRIRTRTQPPASWARSLGAYLRLLERPGPRLVIGTAFLEGALFYGVFTFMGAFLKDRYDMPYVAVGFILGGYGLGGLIYTRIIPLLLRRLGEHGMIVVGGCATCAIFLGLALIPSWLLAIPLTLLLGISFYMVHNTLQTRSTELAPDARGTSVALFAFALFMGQGLGALAMGIMVDHTGYVPVFATAGVGTCLLAIGFVVADRSSLVRSEAHAAISTPTAESPG